MMHWVVAFLGIVATGFLWGAHPTPFWYPIGLLALVVGMYPPSMGTWMRTHNVRPRRYWLAALVMIVVATLVGAARDRFFGN